MTREEIIQAISDDKMMPFIQPEQLAGIVDFVIKNYNTSIPSDLDEAAEDYDDEMWDDLGGVAMVRNNEHDIWYPSSVIQTVFKAGAKWMAQHGVKAKEDK